MRQANVGENENLALLLESTAPHGARFVVRQIAGTLARRIVCRASPGDLFERGERYGMIKFGSRTELYVPLSDSVSVEARPGDRVRGGESVLARLSPTYSTHAARSSDPASLPSAAPTTTPRTT